MDDLEALAALPGAITIGGKAYPVLPPTVGDMIREALQMKQMARAVCVSPIKLAAEHSYLPPAVFATLLSEALKLGSGGGAEPNEAAIRERYAMLDGVRWRLWYHVSRSGHAFTEADAAAVVTDHNCIDVCNALDAALNLPRGEGEKKAAPPTGTTG